MHTRRPTGRFFHGLCGCTFIALLMALGCSAKARASDNELCGTASGNNLWFILEPRGASSIHQLAHHPIGDSSNFFRSMHAMSQSPAALAAWDNQLWMVMPPRASNGGYEREAYSARVQISEATGLAYLTPVGRLNMESSLEGRGRFAGLVATKDGPVALVVPMPLAGPTLRLGDDLPATSGLERPMLMRLQAESSQWMEIPLPAGFIGTRDAHLGLMGDALVILDAVPDNPARCRAFVKRGDQWDESSYILDARDVRSLISVAGQCVAVIDHHQGGPIDLAYLRPSALLPFASFPAPIGSWLVCGSEDFVLVVNRDPGNEEPQLTVTQIDPLTGAARASRPIVSQPLTAGRLWKFTLALGLSLSAVLATVLLRPSPREAIPVSTFRVLPPSRRIVAALIDIAIGAFPAMLIMDCGLADLLPMPLTTASFAGFEPYVVMVSISSVVATVFEMLWGASIGKLLLGARVTDLEGHRPTPPRLLIRGGVRALVYLIPPLAVLVLTNAHMQGLEDMAARTLVLVNEPDKPPTEESES